MPPYVTQQPSATEKLTPPIAGGPPPDWSALLAIEGAPALAAVARYVAAGLYVQAVYGVDDDGACTCTRGKACNQPGKHPNAGNGWQGQTFDGAALARRVRTLESPNLGLRMGVQPNGLDLIALDCDGDLGLLAPLVAELGALPETLTATTGRGFHFIFSVADSSIFTNSASQLSPGIDIRAGHGGQLVCAPSRHVNGKLYQWIGCREPAPLPKKWVDKMSQKAPKNGHESKPKLKLAPKPPANGSTGAPFFDVGGVASYPYAAERLTTSLEAVRMARKNSRRDTLRDNAFAVACAFERGDYVTGSEPRLRDLLTQAALECARLTVHATDPGSIFGADEIESAISSAFAKAPKTVREQAEANEGPTHDDEGRLIIRVRSSRKEPVEFAVTALSQAPKVFKRAHELVRITREAVHAGDGDNAHEGKGPLRIQTLPRAALQQELTHHAAFRGQGKDRAPRARNAPPFVLDGVLALGEWPQIRTIVSVVETPTMSPSLRLIDAPGFDVGTGYYLDPLCEYPPVPEAPTAAEVGAAWEAILEPFCDFMFDTEADRCVAIAAAMTIILRPAIRGSVPAFIFDAPVAGSGKSLAAKAAAISAIGRHEVRNSTWPSHARNGEEELEKALHSHALSAPRIVFFDNLAITAAFGGATLDKILTCGDAGVTFRKLGTNETPSLPWQSVILATGNNVEIVKDTRRRVVVSRIDTSVERPEARKTAAFKHAPLEAFCIEHHPRFVVAVLTIARAYKLAGRPRANPPLKSLGSFESWAALIPELICFAGGVDIIGNVPSLTAHRDEEGEALGVLLEHWLTLWPAGATIKHALKSLYECGSEECVIENETMGALEVLVPPSKIGCAPDPRALGKAFKTIAKKVVNGLQFTSETAQGGVLRWISRKAPSK